MATNNGGNTLFDYYYGQAKEVERKTGWDADVVFGMWRHESANFTSANFRQNNNLAGQTWTPSMGLAKRGTARPRNEGGYYIKYANPVEGFLDFLKHNSRYAKVSMMSTELAQVQEIKKQGWATDPDYVNKVMNTIADSKKKGYYSETRNSFSSEANLIKEWVKGDTTGVSSVLLGRLARLGKQYRQKVEVISGFRSFGEQKKLYDLYKAGKGNLAAEPGSSAHNWGLAVDVTGWAVNVGEYEYIKLGMHKPVKSPQYEPWHIEPTETMNNRSKAGFEKISKQLKNQETTTVGSTFSDTVEMNSFTKIFDKIMYASSTRNGTSIVGSVEDMGDGAYEFLKQIDELSQFMPFGLDLDGDNEETANPFKWVVENGKAIGMRTIIMLIGVLLVASAVFSIRRSKF